jgi:hypothetical protein
MVVVIVLNDLTHTVEMRRGVDTERRNSSKNESIQKKTYIDIR